MTVKTTTENPNTVLAIKINVLLFTSVPAGSFSRDLNEVSVVNYVPAAMLVYHGGLNTERCKFVQNISR